MVSKKSGHLYEKRLIEQYVAEHGKDPVTGEPLTEDDLIPLQSCTYARPRSLTQPAPRTAFPRPPTHSSVPSLLTALQNEYDAMVFETLALRKQYEAARQDLANALYTNDASMRVIARLMKERDDAREALASVHQSLGLPAQTAEATTTDDVDMDAAADAPHTAFPSDMLAQIDETASRLSSERRARIKRGASDASYPTTESVSSLHETASIPSLHGASSPGITALDVSANGQWLLTGGKDKHVLVIDRESEKVLSTLKGHTKPVTAVAFSGRSNPLVGHEAADAAPAPAYAVSASADKTVRVWRHEAEGTFRLAHTWKSHTAEVTGVDVHPTDALVGSASRDGSWALHSLETGERLLHVTQPSTSDDEAGYEYESFAFHPDGQLAATGTADGVIRVWDIKQGRQSALFRTDAGRVHALHFSQNGYLLAAASDQAAEVQIWDLRKLALARRVEAASAPAQVRFDPTAQFLAVVGAAVRVYGGKTLTLCATMDVGDARMTSVQWSPRDGALLVAGMDRTVHMYTP